MGYKLVVVGAPFVGKTSMIDRFMRNRFSSEYIPTMIDFYSTEVCIGQESYAVDICDTSGDEIYDRLTEDHLRTGDGFLCVFSVDKYHSFEKALTFIDKIYLVKPDNPPIVLIVILKLSR